MRNGGLDTLCMFTTVSIIAFSLRVFGGLSKYVVWGAMAVVVFPNSPNRGIQMGDGWEVLQRRDFPRSEGA